MAEKTDSAGRPRGTPIPHRLAPGLDLFAATWLQQWTDAGGSVHFGPEGRAGFWTPEYWCSPEFVEPAQDLPDAIRDEQASFRRNIYHGKMRALLDLLEAVPCGTAAVKAHMRSHGLYAYSGAIGGAA